MPLTVVRAASNGRLWEGCVDHFLDELGAAPGGTVHASHAWLTHRTQRDLLLDAAEARGVAGWLAPPFSFFSELPRRFGIERRPLGHLAGRMLLGRIAARTARELGFEEGQAPGRGHMIDRALSDLLPEGVAPEALEAALARLPADLFGTARNRWLTLSYGAYLSELEARGRFDPRSVHALLADRIAAGELPGALGGAGRLHIYGPLSLRGRARLFEALAAQREIEVRVYLPGEPEAGEWDALDPAGETLPGSAPRPVEVQPVPDAVREAAWVARSVKAVLIEGDVAPHRIAIVARSGREDTRRIREALERAGVPSTARLRSRLAEVPALRAALLLFDAVGQGWTGPTLKPVLKSPYLDAEVDPRGIEVLETRTRPHGLAAWIEGLASLADEARSERGWILLRSGVTADRLERDIPRLERLAAAVAPLEAPRAERAWIEATRDLMRGRPLGMRERVLRPVEERWDIVRLDQRGTLALETLLSEWRDLLSGDGEELTAAEWHDRLRRVLEANELALSTPHQRGVQILEAHEAAATPFERTFLVHANDGVFPRPAAGGLFSDDEASRLVGLGIPFEPRELRIERERRLWRACAGSERVTVSYWTADANGVPRLPSLFVPAHDRSRELPRTRRELAGGPEGAVTRDELLERELVRFGRERRSSGAGPFGTPAPETLRHAALTAFAEELRTGGLDPFAETPVDGTPEPATAFANERPLSERPHPWNGELRDPVVLAGLAERFGDDREWSASWLEQYGRRPFDFLLERVLRLGEARAAEDEANALTVGGLVHDVLERFYRSLDPAQAGGAGLVPPLEARFREAFETSCRRWEQAEDRWVGLPHVWAATRDELCERLRAFLDWELSRKDPGRPIGVELAFGRDCELGSADLSGPGRDGSPRTLLLRGRIDRVDRIGGDGAPLLRVVDYKSGSSAPSPRASEDAAALQGVLYLAAVEALGLGEPAVAVYRTVAAPADRGRRGAADVGPALELARLIPGRVRSGLFEAVQARSTPLRDWQPGRDIVRTAARISSGTRFDLVTPAALPGTGETP